MRARRQFLMQAGSLGLAAAASAAPSRPADVRLVVGNVLTASHPLNVRLAEAATAIRTESRGRVQLQVYPGGQLGSDVDMLEQLLRGEIQGLTISGPVLANRVPVAAINGIGFAFRDEAQVWQAMDGALGAHVRGEIAAAGLHAFDRIWDNGFRQITTSSRPILMPSDLHGLRLRVPVSPLWTSMFRAFGAEPTSLSFGQVYAALQADVVEGQENALAVVQMARLYEVQRHCAMTRHMWDGFWFLAHGKTWAALPADVRELVRTHVDAAALRQRADVRRLNDTLEVQLRGAGMAFTRPPAAPFREVLRRAGFYSDWRRRQGATAWALLEQVVGRLD